MSWANHSSKLKIIIETDVRFNSQLEVEINCPYGKKIMRLVFRIHQNSFTSLEISI